jgi:hypothetical protein
LNGTVCPGGDEDTHYFDLGVADKVCCCSSIEESVLFNLCNIRAKEYTMQATMSALYRIDDGNNFFIRAQVCRVW